MFYKDFLHLKLNLRLFDGGTAGGAAGGAAAAGAASGAAAGSNGTPANGRTGSTGETQIIYQDDGTSAAGKRNTNDSGADPRTADQRYHDMIRGEYKDQHTREINRIIGERFKETKGYQESLNAQQPIMDALSDLYGVSDPAQILEKLNADNALWSDAAEEAGMSPEQYRRYKTMERQNSALMAQEKARKGREAANRQLDEWGRQAEELKAEYPDFDLNTESANPTFLRMLNSNMSVRDAYRACHLDDLMADAEKRLTDDIRARGRRPGEAGSSAATPITVKNDVHKLSRAQRRELANEAARGKTITFG